MTEITKKALGSIVSRMKKGTSTLGQESKALGINRNGPLRAALVLHLGSQEAYTALIGKSWEQRLRKKATGTKRGKKTSTKKAARAKTADKNPSPDDGNSKDSSDDDDSSGEPQDLCTLMSGGQEEERREELEQNGVAGIDTEQAMSLV